MLNSQRPLPIFPLISTNPNFAFLTLDSSIQSISSSSLALECKETEYVWQSKTYRGPMAGMPNMLRSAESIVSVQIMPPGTVVVVAVAVVMAPARILVKTTIGTGSLEAEG
ncbi:unnamed protein product [Linum trigynum]|uniref:Uncharacterized protein n=1 Tax=Linum trigynum TaxID=586398 RepID=A0AAV2FLX3_9ROSI